MKAQFDLVAPQAIEGIKNFSRWLQDDLAKRKTDRTWSLGKELYAEKFRLVMETPVTPDQVLADAERELRKTRAEMLQIALPLHKQYFPDHDDHASLSPLERENKVISEVLQRISEDRPTRDQLMPTVKDDLAGIRQFILDKKIVSLKSRDNLKVIPTPPFMRGSFSVAGFHSAPPLDPNAEAQYWVTPIDPKTPEDQAESKLREYNNWVLKWLTIHEALPGHYVEAEHANEIQPVTRRLVRGLYGNGAYVEGWAEYIAQVMMQQGFADNDPRYHISYLKVWLHAVGNTAIRKGLGKRHDGGVDGSDGRVGRFWKERRISRHEHNSALGLFERWPCRDRQSPRTVQLKRQTAVPLFVGHFENVDLRDRAGDVEQCIDPAKGGKRLFDHFLCRRGIGKIDIHNKGLGTGRFHGGGSLLEILASARCEHDRGKILCETDSSCSSDTLAGARNNRY